MYSDGVLVGLAAAGIDPGPVATASQSAHTFVHPANGRGAICMSKMSTVSRSSVTGQAFDGESMQSRHAVPPGVQGCFLSRRAVVGNKSIGQDVPCHALALLVYGGRWQRHQEHCQTVERQVKRLEVCLLGCAVQEYI
eukprot:1826991-Amphidinium_carterae.2